MWHERSPKAGPNGLESGRWGDITKPAWPIRLHNKKQNLVHTTQTITNTVPSRLTNSVRSVKTKEVSWGKGNWGRIRKPRSITYRETWVAGSDHSSPIFLILRRLLSIFFLALYAVYGFDTFQLHAAVLSSRFPEDSVSAIYDPLWNLRCWVLLILKCWFRVLTIWWEIFYFFEEGDDSLRFGTGTHMSLEHLWLAWSTKMESSWLPIWEVGC